MKKKQNYNYVSGRDVAAGAPLVLASSTGVAARVVLGEADVAAIVVRRLAKSPRRLPIGYNNITN